MPRDNYGLGEAERLPTESPPRLNADQLLFSVEDAADDLNVGRTTMYGLIASGAIRTVTIGRRRLIPRSELTAFVERLLQAESSES